MITDYPEYQGQIAHTTIKDAHEAILAKAREFWPWVQTASAYQEFKGDLDTPAVFLELVAIESGTDPGTQQFGARFRWSLFLMLSHKQPFARMRIRQWAADACTKLYAERFGQHMGRAEIIGAYPDEFLPQVDSYELWRVDFEQEANLGSPVQWGRDFAPIKVYIPSGMDAGGDPSKYTDLEDLLP